MLEYSNAVNAVKTVKHFRDNPFVSVCFSKSKHLSFRLTSHFKLFYTKTSYVWILFCFLFTFSCPSLTIPGFTHPVDEYFLSDVYEMLGQALPHPGHPQGKRFKPDNSFVKVFLVNIFLSFCQLFSFLVVTLSIMSLTKSLLQINMLQVQIYDCP